VATILGAAGYEEATIHRVQTLLRRVRLDEDSGTQALEDVACLAFLETQLVDLAGRLADDHMVTVVQKVAVKMSPEALVLVGRIPLDDDAMALLGRALD
jgi:hypothetical protein